MIPLQSIRPITNRIEAMPLLPLATFTRLDWAIIALYLAGMVLIGHVVGRKKTDAKGYFLGDRSSPTWAVVLSIIATSLSAATFLGAPQEAFQGDLTYLILNLGNFIGVVIVAAIFIPRFYAAGTVTIYGYLNRRFGEPARIATSVMFLIGRLLASGARLFMAAGPVCLLLFHPNRPQTPPTHSEQILAILLIGAVGIAYTVSGGIRAVIWTDSAQIIIVVGAAILSIVLLLKSIPLPVSRIIHELSQPGTGLNGHSKLHLFDGSFDLAKRYTIWVALFSTTFTGVAAYGVDHDLVQRMLTAKSAWRGSFSVVAAQVLGIFVAILFMVIGLLLYIYYNRPDLMGAAAPKEMIVATKDIYPRFLLTLPTGLAGLAMAGLFAAAQGSLDSAINAMASSAVADVYWPIRRMRGLAVDTTTRAPKIGVAIMGATLIVFAIGCVYLYDQRTNTLLSFALGIMAFAYTGMLGVFLTALLTRRGSNTSVLAALAVGVIVTALLQDGIYQRWTAALFGSPKHVNNLWAMTIGTPISFLVCLAGKPKASFNSGFEVV
jgi:SSS family solute:Na+ symporter